LPTGLWIERRIARVAFDSDIFAGFAGTLSNSKKMAGYTKLFSDLLASSIWNEDDKTRIVWITLLAMRGSNNVVRATIGGLAHQARVSTKDCRMAVDKLLAPDPDGLTQPYEGRRIQEVDHGWFILNGEEYQQRRDDEDRKEYQREWVRKKREKERLSKQSTESTTVDTVYTQDLTLPNLTKEHIPTCAYENDPSPPSLAEFLAYGYTIGVSEPDCKTLWEEWSAADWCLTDGRRIEKWKARLLTWRNRALLPSQTGKLPNGNRQNGCHEAAFKPTKEYVRNYFQKRMRYGGWGELYKHVYQRLITANFVWRDQPIRDQEHAEAVMNEIAEIWKSKK
jgi:hypothetical protein